MKDGALMDITGSSMTWTSIGWRGLCDGSGNMGRKDVLSDTYDGDTWEGRWDVRGTREMGLMTSVGGR